MKDDIVFNTMDDRASPQARLLAVKLYCEGVKEDYRSVPQFQILMDNILILAGFDPDET